MKKSYVISLGAISLIADIITLTSAFKWVLTNWLGVSEETATSINTWVLIGGILLLLFVLYLIYKMVKDKLIDAGTHGIACEIVPYYRYKVRNRMNTMLRLRWRISLTNIFAGLQMMILTLIQLTELAI